MSWGDLESPPVPEDKGETVALQRSFVRAFSGNDGEAVLADLRARTLDMSLNAKCTDAELRDLEGQRRLVRYIINQIERGVRS